MSRIVIVRSTKPCPICQKTMNPGDKARVFMENLQVVHGHVECVEERIRNRACPPSLFSKPKKARHGN